MRKILWTSDAWLTSWSHWSSEPAYYLVHCRISHWCWSIPTPLETFQTFLRPCITRHCISTHGFKTISKIHYSRQQRSKAIRLPNELHENAFRNHLHLRNAPDQPKGRPTIGLLICTLISENQGLKKLRFASSHRIISGPAHLDFFRVYGITLAFF